ncbi:MAG TPA: hypothetical protein VOA87_23145 [Thermoanaerobaculia bacterium]|nr:hypothetical protein [Thermoanaerobaculia bacterium]
MIIRVTLAIVGIGLAVTPAGSAQAAAGSSTGQVEILSPKDGQHIGAEGDALCPSAPQPCFKIRAEGRVPEERFPFFAVEPVLVSPKMWIQPLIHRARQDGSFSGLVYLGKEGNGALQYFKIYLFACERQDRFSDGDTMFNPPTDCLVSAPVEVYRER